MESNVDEFNDVIAVIPQEMEIEGSNVCRNLDGDDIEMIDEMGFDDGCLRRNSIADIPQRDASEGGDTRRYSCIVIPAGIEATGADARRRSIARSIQSRYLKATMASCHDYCKYGTEKNTEESPKNSERKTRSTIDYKPSSDSLVTEKKIIPTTKNLDDSPKTARKMKSTTNSKPSPDSPVMEKRVISVTKKGTPTKKGSSSMEVDVPKEDLFDAAVKGLQHEPSSKATDSDEPSPDSVADKSIIIEKEIVSVTNRSTVSSEKGINVTTEDSMDLEEQQPELSEPSPLTGAMKNMQNSKAVSRTSSKVSHGSEIPKRNDSAVTQKKANSVMKKKDSSLSTKEVSSFVPMEEQASYQKGNSGTRKSKEALDVSSITKADKSIRSQNRWASLSGAKQTIGLQTVSLSTKDFNRRHSNVNPGISYNLKGASHVNDQNDPGRVEPEPPCDENAPEKILYVIESSTENITMESTPDAASVPKPAPLSPVPVEGKSKNARARARKGVGKTETSPSFEMKRLRRFNVSHPQSAAPLNQDKRLKRVNVAHPQSDAPLNQDNKGTCETVEAIGKSKVQLKTTPRRSVESIGKSRVQLKTTPRRSAIVGSGNQNSVSRKLTFRRGRVIELQPENITPRRLKFRRRVSSLDDQKSKDSVTGGSIEKKEVNDTKSSAAEFLKRRSNLRKEAGNIQSSGAGIIKRVSTVRKEVGDRQSNGVAIKRPVIVKKKVDDDQTNGSGLKRVSSLKKEPSDRQPNSVAVKRAIIGNKEVDDNQTNNAKIRSVKVGLRKLVSSSKVLRKKWDGVGVSDTEKVVLKHQDVQGKKDDQISFNNVIEETASKLVETRKSKVLALVGAFETVISLQETRPAIKADAC